MGCPIHAGTEHRRGFLVDGAIPFPPPEISQSLSREAIAKLVDGLYDGIEKDPVLRPAFNHDLTRERGHVKLFFESWFGGESSYYDEDWRPGLGPIHERISISRGMAGRWLGHFLRSLAEVTDDQELIGKIKPVVTQVAMALVSRDDEPAKGERVRGVCSATDRPFLKAITIDSPVEIVRASDADHDAIHVHGPALLLTAAVKGKLLAARELLDQGVDPNCTAILPGGEAKTHGLPMLRITPLCGALARKREAVASLLVERGARYDIFSAALLGDVESVRSMLDDEPGLAGAFDPACDVARVTPLLHAVRGGQIEVAKLLLERGATVGPNSVRLLSAAAEVGNEDLVDLLLRYGADPCRLGPGPWVLFPSISEKLLAHGANVNRPSGRWVGLSCTGNSGHKENAALVEAFLRAGADVSAIYAGRTAMHCAAKAGYTEVLRVLIANGGDVNARDDRGQTPLDVVAQAGKSIDREPVRWLLLQGAR